MTEKNKEGLQGATFGVMEATIMMLAVMMGLSATGNRFVVAIGLLTAGLADAVANAAAFHVSEETETVHTRREIWKSTIYTFLATLVTVAVLIWPVLLMEIKQAVITSWVIGVIILLCIGYSVSRLTKRAKPIKLMAEYLAFGILAAALCYGLGVLVVHLTHGLA